MADIPVTVNCHAFNPNDIDAQQGDKLTFKRGSDRKGSVTIHLNPKVFYKSSIKLHRHRTQKPARIRRDAKCKPYPVAFECRKASAAPMTGSVTVKSPTPQ